MRSIDRYGQVCFTADLILLLQSAVCFADKITPLGAEDILHKKNFSWYISSPMSQQGWTITDFPSANVDGGLSKTISVDVVVSYDEGCHGGVVACEEEGLSTINSLTLLSSYAIDNSPDKLKMRKSLAVPYSWIPDSNHLSPSFQKISDHEYKCSQTLDKVSECWVTY